MVQITVNVAAVALRLAVAADRARKGTQKVLRDAGAFHVRQMIQRMRPYAAGQRRRGGVIQTRSGALRRSFGFEERPGRVRIFSSGLPYIRVQEFGGAIRPTRRQFLTIPLPPALTPAGVLKGGARLVQRGRRWETARGNPTFIRKRVIFEKDGDSIIPLYVLKTEVRLEPRLGFGRTFESKTRPFVEKRLEGIKL